LRKQDVQCKSHFLFPEKENVDADCNLILKHYKFQPGEIEKYKEIANNGNYYDGSKQYKKYIEIMEKTKTLDFMCNSTKKYVDSKSLRQITGYHNIIWDYGE